ncbi:hypothetical protein FOA52_015748 [Chlamydomonas sp. UWO 241]|nr:hypothetical protein FOA52_015748 [Chlamydomonas sp. UWO 241]
MRIAFLHPDLGLGGAERLVVDAAVELVKCGHMVDVYTAYYDPKRCFPETKTGGFTVHVAGGWFPRAIAGRCIALCAYIRCILAALVIVWRSWFYRATCIEAGCQPFYDVVIADQVSAVVPFIRFLTHSKMLFYCHFPDLLLSTKRESLVKRLYRVPLDTIEQATTGMSHLVLVNSAFTKAIFKSTFTRLADVGIEPGVLSPAVEPPSDEELQDAESWWADSKGDKSELSPALHAFCSDGPVLLSINRFERKKGIVLAVDALAALLKVQQNDMRDGSFVLLPTSPRLVIAGGYDVRLAENREHLEELKAHAASLGLTDHVQFLPSFTDRQRSLLLAACTAVLYTPEHEHFGIVPLEAMAAGRPVVCCSSGGPLESVVHGKTGMLCAPDADVWASALASLLVDKSMGEHARKHVLLHHSRAAFGARLDVYVHRLAAVGGAGASATRASASASAAPRRRGGGGSSGGGRSGARGRGQRVAQSAARGGL